MNGREWQCSFEEYLALDAESSGRACDFFESPALYAAKYIHKTIVDDEPTDAMVLGSAIHALVLEGPVVFAERFAVGPCDDKRSKAWKEWDVSTPLHLMRLRASQGATVHACLAALHLHDDARRALFEWPGTPELSGTWEDDDTGLLCKLRFDRHVASRWTPVELKSSRRADPDTVQRTAISMGYHRRAAWYTDGHREIYGQTPNALVFITVATDMPDAVLEDRVNVWRIDSALEELGARDIRTALDGIAAARKSGVWRADWTRDVNVVTAPRWMASAI